MVMAKRKLYSHYGFKPSWLNFVVLILCILLGMLIGNRIKLNFLGRYSEAECGIVGSYTEADKWSSLRRSNMNSHTNTNGNGPIRQSEKDSFMVVGVMTAKKFIDTRGLSAFRTWVNSINGKVIFFSSEGSRSSYGVPVVALPGVDDSYPPQKKSFMMLKYMHDHYIYDYEWFIRADDDIFIKGDKLEKFLRSINSSKPQFIGQAGVGKQEELGQLSLTINENFCMGGPGMIFSRETLRRMAPYVGDCLSNLLTLHEDVEIGRCVRKHAGIQCTWAYEMQQILYQNYKEDKGSFKKSLKSKEVENAVSLHPVKEPVYLFHIQNYFHSTKITELYNYELVLRRDIYVIENILGHLFESKTLPSLNKYRPAYDDEVIAWEYFTKPIFSHLHSNPKRGFEGYFSEALHDTVNQIMRSVNKNARQRGRTLDYKEILYGYKKVNPSYSVNYVLDLLLIYRKHKGRKMTVPVRRHAYIQQPFAPIEIAEFYTNEHPNLPIKSIIKPSDEKRISLFSDIRSQTINFILTVVGRFRNFQRFMKNFEEVCLLTRENVKLHVVLFKGYGHEENDVKKSVNILQQYQIKYGIDVIHIVKASGGFSRGRGLELGAANCDRDSLLYLVDVDILLNKSALYRIRLNTKQGSQVYFPIVFSQYNPSTVCFNSSNCNCNQSNCVINPWDFSIDSGYWRQFGYGIASMYRSDMLSVGGFDLSIHGWGKEDVDLFEKFINSNITIYRAVDTGMTHAFHEIVCDTLLEPSQLVMCSGSMSLSYGGVRFLSNYAYENEHVLKKDEIFALNVNL